MLFQLEKKRYPTNNFATKFALNVFRHLVAQVINQAAFASLMTVKGTIKLVVDRILNARLLTY